MTIDREALRERLIKARETAGTCFTTLRNETADEVIAALSALDQPAQEPEIEAAPGYHRRAPERNDREPDPLGEGEEYGIGQPATLPDESR